MELSEVCLGDLTLLKQKAQCEKDAKQRGRFRADAMAVLEKEFGVQYSLSGVYALMHRLNLSCLKPRPQHLKNDPGKM